MVQKQQMATIYKSKHIHPHSNPTHTTQHDYVRKSVAQLPLKHVCIASYKTGYGILLKQRADVNTSNVKPQIHLVHAQTPARGGKGLVTQPLKHARIYIEK